MAFTVTVTPGAQLAAGELLDPDEFNAAALPTVAVAGALTDLSNINITSVSDGQVLTYNTATSKWINQSSSVSGFATGDLKVSLVAAAPSGWLLCDGSEKSQSTYAALYAVLGSTYANGLETAGYFRLPDFRGARLVGAGGVGVQYLRFTTANVNATNDTIEVTGDVKTGAAITLVGALPPGNLTNGVTYYAIYQSYNSGTHKTTLKVASSLANAVAGTAIDISSTGSDPMYFTHSRSTRSLGNLHGWETHALTTAELAAHAHGPGNGSSFVNYDPGSANHVKYEATDLKYNTSATTASAGSSTAHNSVTPEIAVNVMIKT